MTEGDDNEGSHSIDTDDVTSPLNVNMIDEETGDEDPEALDLIDTISDCISAISRSEQAARNVRKNSEDNQSIIPNLLKRHRISRNPLDRGEMDTFGTGERLKHALDNLAEYTRSVYQHRGSTAVDEIMENLASVPLLIKTILFLDSEDETKSMLSHPCIRRVLCMKSTALSCKDVAISATGTSTSTLRHSNSGNEPWILEVMRFMGASASQKLEDQNRVVLYFEIVSNLTVLDYISVLLNHRELEEFEVEQHIPDEELRQDFRDEKSALFTTISSLPMLIPLLFNMSNKMVERASVTTVIQHALNTAVQRPLMIAQVFIDFGVYIVLLVLVRNAIVRDLGDLTSLERYCLLALGPSTLTYLISRVVGDLLVFSRVSRDAFLQNLMYRWTIVDLVAPILVLVCVIYRLAVTDPGRTYYKYLSVICGLLWLKTLSFFQNANPKLSVYVISLFETVQDVWLFLLILLTTVLAFGDMFYTIYIAFRDDNIVCPKFTGDFWAAKVENYIASPFCDSRRGQSYLGVYSLLVGDVNVNNFNGSKFSGFLFVLASFFGAILLLNMLIAIIVASYQRSVSRSKGLFGRSRVGFVAKSILMEQGLQEQGLFGLFYRFFFYFCIFGVTGYTVTISWLEWAKSFVGNDEDIRTKQASIAIGCISLFIMAHGLFLFLTRKGILKSTNPLCIFLGGLFHCFIGIPATLVSGMLLGIAVAKRKQQMLNDQGGSSFDREISITNTTLRVEKRLKRLEEARESQKVDFDVLLEKLQSIESKLLAKSKQ